MPGPWDKFQKTQPQEEQGPWNKFSAPDKPAEKPSSLGEDLLTAGHQFTEGLTNLGGAKGYLPEVYAGLDTVVDPVAKKITGLINGIEMPEDKSTYVQKRDDYRKMLNKEEQEHPYISTGSKLAAIIPQAVATGGLASEGGMLARIARAGAIGGAGGLVSNPGEVEGEVSPLQLGERVRQAKTGAITGGLLQGAGEGVVKVGKTALGVGKSGLDYAGQKALKAMGISKSDLNKLMKQPGISGDFEKVQQFGNDLAESKLIKAGDTFDDIYSKVQEFKDKAGKKIGEIYKNATSASESIPADIKPSGQEIGLEVMDKVGQKFQGLTSGGDEAAKIAEEFATRFSRKKFFNPEELQKEIKYFDNEMINWGRSPVSSEKEAAYRTIRSTLQSKLDGILDGLEKAGVGKASDIKEARKAFQMAARANDIVSNRMKSEIGNRFFSPTDYAMGLGGAATGVMAGKDLEEKFKLGALGLGAGLLNKGARKYSNPALMQGGLLMDKAAPAIKKASQVGSGLLGPKAIGQ